MINYNELPDYVQEAVQEMSDYNEGDMEALTWKEVFKLWLEYEGIINYSDTIIEVLDAIRKADNHETSENDTDSNV